MHNLKDVRPNCGTGASVASSAGDARDAFTVAAGHRIPLETVLEYANSGLTVCIRKYEWAITGADCRWPEPVKSDNFEHMQLPARSKPASFKRCIRKPRLRCV